MRQRLYVAAVLGGLALVVAAGVAVLQWGRSDPSPPSLADHPNPAIPGKIAYVDRDGCIATVLASGADRTRLYCVASAAYGPPLSLSWLDAGTIGYLEVTSARLAASGAPQYELVRLDVASRQIRRSGQLYPADKLDLFPGSARAPNGDGITTDEDGNVFLVHEGARTRIASFDAPEYRGPQPAGWSPDSNWIVLRYFPRNAGNRSELWLLSRDGQTGGTLVTDAAGGGPGLAWWIDGTGSWPRPPE